MPELPEVECLRRSLEPHLMGAMIDSVELRRRDVCTSWGPGKSDRPVRVRTEDASLLSGDSIQRMVRRGKQLALIGTSGRVVCIHLGMSGQVLILPGDQPVPRGDHVHAVWTLRGPHSARSSQMLFRDPRRFGGIVTLAEESLLQSHHWRSLGPDALTIGSEHLAAALGDSRRAVKTALLDQRVLAGVGNIYADEALFAARIAPKARCSQLHRRDWDRLAVGICSVLSQAITRGGSTLRDYLNADGARGEAQQSHMVYGRAGEECRVCRHNLASATLGQRTTVWCPRCQAKP